MEENEKMQVRVIKYIVGLFIMTLGVSFAIKSNLGAAPVSTVPYSITLISGLEMGLATMGFQSLLVVIQIIILRRKFKLKNLLQIPISIMFGWMTTLSNYLVAMLPDTDNIVLRFLMILASCIVIALGIAWYVPADIVPLPTEGLIKTISDISGAQFSNIKIAVDCTLVVISGVLCLCFTGSFGSIGVGTVILAVMVGIINKQILRLFGMRRMKYSKVCAGN